MPIHMNFSENGFFFCKWPVIGPSCWYHLLFPIVKDYIWSKFQLRTAYGSWVYKKFCNVFFHFIFFFIFFLKFSIKEFFNKFDQIHRELQIWSYLLKKELYFWTVFIKFHLFVNILYVTYDIQLGKQFGIIHLVRKQHFRKINISFTLIRTSTCAYFVYLLNKSPLPSCLKLQFFE